jgi:hypothetical protein
LISRRSFLGSAPLFAQAAAAQSGDGAVPAEASIVAPKALAAWSGRLAFALDPPVTEWHIEGGESSDRVSYTGGDYRLDLMFDRAVQDLLVVRFRLDRRDGRAFSVRSYSLKAQLSLLGIYRFWSSRGGPIELLDQFRVYTRGLGSGKEFAEVYAANSGMPVMLCADREGVNRFALGMLDQVETAGLRIADYSLGLSRRGEGLNFSFEFVRPVGYSISRTALVDAAWFDSRRLSWFHTLGNYAEWVEKTSNVSVLRPPPPAYEPIWNTWYPFGQAIDEHIITENAAFCRKAGITTLCLDAGYNNGLTLGMSNAQEIEVFNAHTGDWTANAAKFPDFGGMVERLHGEGHKVTVWVALFIVGKETRAYAEVRDLLRHDSSGAEDLYLCPCHPETPAYLARTFLKLASQYNLDGFWLDFMDGMHKPCHASHPHATSSTGDGYNRCLAAVRDAVMKWKPEFLIETRMKMANINMKQFANVFETYDMPFDFDLNRGFGVVLRSYSRGVATKLDPAQWHIHESIENVAKSCATVTLMGVPVFGVDFRLLPESHVRVVAAWMRFYRQHRADLIQGQFEPLGFGSLYPQFRIRSGQKAFIYVGSLSTAPVDVAGCREIYIVNAADTDRLSLALDGAAPGRWTGDIRNCLFEQAGSAEETVSGEKMRIDRHIPQGGVLALRRA